MSVITPQLINAALYVAGGMMQEDYDKNLLVDRACKRYGLDDSDLFALENLWTGFLSFGIAIREAERDKVKIAGTRVRFKE